MSDIPPPPNFWNFMYKLDPNFNGTAFCFNGKRLNVSRINYVLWDKIVKEYECAKSIVPTIAFGIPFCIAYQNALQTPDSQKIFGYNIGVAFPVPENVQDFFRYRTVLYSDQKAGLLTSKLQDLSSQIRELNDRLASSKSYLLELVAEVEQLRRDLAYIQSKFHEADERVSALTNLMNATNEVKSLFGRDLAVLQPEFFSEMQAFECRRKIFSEQMQSLENHISIKDRMVLDQREGIALFEASLRAQAQAQRENESALLTTRQKIFQELSKLELDSLPPTLTKYVEELRLHTNMQQAALVLAKHVKKVSDRRFVDSRKDAIKECSICCSTKADYLVLGCFHAFCSDCTPKFNKICPKCRKQITSTKSLSLNLFDKQIFIY